LILNHPTCTYLLPSMTLSHWNSSVSVFCSIHVSDTVLVRDVCDVPTQKQDN